MDTGTTPARAAERYRSMGWALTGIPAGSKAPATVGWQKQAAPDDYWDRNPSHNIGLIHHLSGTCALDIDHMPHTRLVFDALNIDLDGILAAAPRIIGRPDRGKVLFLLPADIQLTTRKISWPVEGDPRRTEVVFELRAGTVQDVLPPSIHPDTGNPYRWAGMPPEQIGAIPERLLTVWREWDRFRPQIADLCPWRRVEAFTPPPSRPRATGEGQSVIAAYNAATTVAAELEAAGYRRIGTRMLSPNSTSGIPGVIIFDDGRAYSHHASDPFDPAHSFDAFEVFCTYQHLGNVTAAVKAAAELLDIKTLPEGPSEQDREYQLHGAQVAKAITGRSGDSVPPHLLTVPGVLGRVVAYSKATAIKWQPQFDVQTALALGSLVMGRRFMTCHRNMTSLYFLNIGKTGCGKEHANTVLEDILEASALPELIGPNGYTSATGVLSALKEKPVHLAVIDEFGAMLSSAGARGNQHKRDALTKLMEAFGRQSKTLRNVGYATVGMTEGQKKAMNTEIKSPSITLIGMSTPDTFYEAVGARDVASGFLNRFVIVETNRRREASRKPSQTAVPPEVIAWCQAAAGAEGDGGNLTDRGHEFPPAPVMLDFNAGAEKLFRDYEIGLNARQDAMPDAQADMLIRTREIAMRLSLIVARSLGDDEITEASAQWAIDYVDYYATQTLAAMAEKMAEGENDSVRKAVARAIRDAGSAGLKINEIIKAVPRVGNLLKMQRDALLAGLCEEFPIARVVSKPAKGRPAVLHVCTEQFEI